MTRLILWRHGRTDWNASGRVQGHLNSELDDTGQEQARAAAGVIAGYRPSAIITSDLHRVVDTVAPLAGRTGVPVRTDVRLRERFFGSWQGLTLDEVRAAHPEQHRRWRAGERPVGCGVEEIDEVAARVAEALTDAAARHAGGVVVVGSHGGAIRYGLSALLGWPPEAARTLGGLGNAHWADLRHDETRGWRLYGYNLGVDTP